MGRYVWRSRLREVVNRKSERDLKRYTGKDIANATGIRYPTVAAWLRLGATFERVDINVLMPLAEWVGVRAEDLIEAVELDDTEGQPAAAATS